MRTKNLLEFKKEVSQINNYQSQIKFVFEQFQIDNKDKFEKGKEDIVRYSSKIYESNKYAEEFNVEFQDIFTQLSDTKNFIFKSIYVFLYSRFEIFLRNEYFIAKYELNLEIPEMGKFKIPETFFEQLEVNILEELMTTFEYLRLRRNAIVHRTESKVAQGEISAFIKSNGKKLNNFWSKKTNFADVKGVAIKKINFLDTSLENFQEAEVIDVFNLYRVLSEVIDKTFVEKFNRDKWLEFLGSKFKQQISTDKKTSLISEKEIKWFAHELLNMSLTNEEITKIYRGVV